MSGRLRLPEVLPVPVLRVVLAVLPVLLEAVCMPVLRARRAARRPVPGVLLRAPAALPAARRPGVLLPGPVLLQGPVPPVLLAARIRGARGQRAVSVPVRVPGVLLRAAGRARARWRIRLRRVPVRR